MTQPLTRQQRSLLADLISGKDPQLRRYDRKTITAMVRRQFVLATVLDPPSFAITDAGRVRMTLKPGRPPLPPEKRKPRVVRVNAEAAAFAKKQIPLPFEE